MKKIIVLLCIGLVITGCTKNTETKEIMKPENTLISFFENVSKQDFNKAISYFTEDKEIWESLRVYTLPDEKNHANIIKNYCQATMTCLPIHIIETKQISENEYHYKVQFYKEDGSIFILGPCCGATEEEMPSQDTFEYTVKKTDNTFKVMTPPIYVP